MVGTPERSLVHKPHILDLAHYAVYFGGFQGLVQGHWRQNGGQALGQHSLSRAGGTDQDDIMSASSSNFHTAFNALLPFYIGKIEFGKIQVFIKLGLAIYYGPI